MAIRQATRKEISDAHHIEMLKAEQEEYREYVKRFYPNPELVSYLVVETTPEYNDEGGYDNWVNMVDAYDVNGNQIELYDDEDGDIPDEVRDAWLELPVPENDRVSFSEVFGGPRLLIDDENSTVQSDEMSH